MYVFLMQVRINDIIIAPNANKRIHIDQLMISKPRALFILRAIHVGLIDNYCLPGM